MSGCSDAARRRELRPAAGIDRAAALDGRRIDQHDAVVKPAQSLANIAISQSIVSVARRLRFQYVPSDREFLAVARRRLGHLPRLARQPRESLAVAQAIMNVTTSAWVALRLAFFSPIGQEIVSGGEHR